MSGAGPGPSGQAVEAGGQAHLRGGHAGQLITILTTTIILHCVQVRADPRLEVTRAGDLVITGFQPEDVGEYEVAVVCGECVQ